MIYELCVNRHDEIYIIEVIGFYIIILENILI